jgi:hypothetical protein
MPQLPVQWVPPIEPPPLGVLGPDIIEPIEEPPPQLESATSPQSVSNKDESTRDRRPTLLGFNMAALREQRSSLAYARFSACLTRDLS